MIKKKAASRIRLPNSHVYDSILRVYDSILRVYDFILRVSCVKFPCFSFFSTTIWLERMFIYPIALIMLLIARLFSFSEKKSLRSDKIVVRLPMASKFELCFLATIKSLISNALNKLGSLIY